MGRIESITDQLGMYVNEVVASVERLKRDHKFTTGEAIKIVELGLRSMECDVYWREVCDKEDALIDATR